MDSTGRSNGSNPSEIKESVLNQLKNAKISKQHSGGMYLVQMLTVMSIIFVSLYKISSMHDEHHQSLDSSFWYIILSAAIGILLPTPAYEVGIGGGKRQQQQQPEEILEFKNLKEPTGSNFFPILG